MTDRIANEVTIAKPAGHCTMLLMSFIIWNNLGII